VKLRIGMVKETDRIVPRLIPRIILPTAVLLAIVGWLSGATDAQTPSGPLQDAKPDPQLRISPLRTLRNLESASDQENRLGRGDEITVDCVACADLTVKLVVGPDGRIKLPLASDRMLAGRTREQAAKDIDAALSTYYTNLAAQVMVTKYAAIKVLVLGAVQRPGVVTSDGAPRQLDALSRSGLETGPNKASRIPERRAIYRGHDEAALVEYLSPTITAAALFGVGLP
jgi:polysaccharide biosynthesis/export protein